MIEFLKQIRKKDKNAVQLIYNNYGKKLYGYAMLKWNFDEDEAWDIVYATLYKVIEVSDKYTFVDEKKFKGFVFTAFTNNLRNYYNKKKLSTPETIELTEKYDVGINDVEEEQKESVSPEMNCLQRVLTTVEDWKRILLLMRAQDYSYEEISNYVSKPAEQLKVYYMRIKKLVTEKVNECLNTKL